MYPFSAQNGAPSVPKAEGKATLFVLSRVEGRRFRTFPWRRGGFLRNPAHLLSNAKTHWPIQVKKSPRMHDRRAYFLVARVRRDALQPGLAPVRVDASRAEHPTVTVSGLTDYGVENDARIPKFPHHTGFLVNDFADSLEYAVRPATVGDHLRVEEEPTVLIFRVQSVQNILVRLYANKFTGLQVEGCCGRRLSDGNAPAFPGKLRAMPERMEFVIEPPHGRSQSDTGLAEAVVHRIDQAIKKLPQADVT